MAQTRIRQIGEGDTDQFADFAPQQPQIPPQAPHPAENFAANILLTSLRALSQRALVAIGNLFVLATAISAWWLWMVTLPAPTIPQLVGLGLYGVLILCLNWLVLRRI